MPADMTHLPTMLPSLQATLKPRDLSEYDMLMLLWQTAVGENRVIKQILKNDGPTDWLAGWLTA